MYSLQGAAIDLNFAIQDIGNFGWDVLVAGLEGAGAAADWVEGAAHGTAEQVVGVVSVWLGVEPPEWVDDDWATKAGWIDKLSASTIGHAGLDIIGVLPIPIVSSVADLANAAWYAYEGDKVNAALSVLSAAPIIGDTAGYAKYGAKFKAAISCLDAAEGAGKFFNTVRKLERGANFIEGGYNFGQGAHDAYKNG